jgi:hypothetical protein
MLPNYKKKSKRKLKMQDQMLDTTILCKTKTKVKKVWKNNIQQPKILKKLSKGKLNKFKRKELKNRINIMKKRKKRKEDNDQIIVLGW